MNFQKLNNILGFSVFAFSSIVYLLTIEPHFSFWDCGEYISSAAKLEVTHSPGAALFQIMGAVFSMFAFGDGALYGKVLNAMSGIFSSLTVMFLFWVIVHFSKKIVVKSKDTEPNTLQKIILLGSGLIGALSFTFTDTFWFSAIEGEVYAMASLFTALLIWLICKWEAEADKASGFRWLVLICFVIGLSIGVHLMVILALPAVCLLYYAKNYTFSWKSFAVANLVTLLIFAFVFKYYFTSLMTYFSKMELFFVNGLDMPFNSGTFIAFVLLFGAFIYGIYLTQKKKLILLNNIILGLFFMIIGFSCWLMIPIRANANPPMNLNNPDNAQGMLDYFNREQYGEWPVLYGPNYTAYLDNEGILESYKRKPVYEKDEKTGKYIVTSHRLGYKFNPKHVSFFPRMYNPDPSVIKNYQSLAGLPEPYRYEENQNGERIPVLGRPSFLQNVKFFLDFQVGYMFVRYLMWNFVGKQNHFEGNYGITKGNWESGIGFIDNIRLGKEKLPDSFESKGTNHYYFIPFILGLIGLFFQLNRNFKEFYALFSLFFLTGVGIILYTSVKPFEPRERDYALVSAFYTFSIWIGLSIPYIFVSVSEKFKKKPYVLGLVALGMISPLLLATENWDDHDRSDRKTAYALAHNYLEPLEKNSILFVYGDNDTYPLWAIQETEGFRTDVRVANFTLLSTGWNIEQNQRKIYEAEALPSYLKKEEYRDGKNETIKVIPKQELEYILKVAKEEFSSTDFSFVEEFAAKEKVTVKEALDFIRTKDEGKRRILNLYYADDIDDANILVNTRLVLPVNKEKAIESKIIKVSEKEEALDEIAINLQSSSIQKAQFFMLAMLSNYNWDRPIYFSSGGLYDSANTLFLQDYLETEGFSYKLVPFKNPENPYTGEFGKVDGENMYQNFKNMKWGGFDNPKAFFDDTSTRNILTYRNAASSTAMALIQEGENKKAIEVLDLVNAKIPYEIFMESEYALLQMAEAYSLAGEDQKAQKLMDVLEKNAVENIEYHQKVNSSDQESAKQQAIYSNINKLKIYHFLEKKDTLSASKELDIYFENLPSSIAQSMAFNENGGLMIKLKKEDQLIKLGLDYHKEILNALRELSFEDKSEEERVIDHILEYSKTSESILNAFIQHNKNEKGLDYFEKVLVLLEKEIDLKVDDLGLSINDIEERQTEQNLKLYTEFYSLVLENASDIAPEFVKQKQKDLLNARVFEGQ